jgi:hypothetical protein
MFLPTLTKHDGFVWINTEVGTIRSATLDHMSRGQQGLLAARDTGFTPGCSQINRDTVGLGLLGDVNLSPITIRIAFDNSEVYGV